MPIINATCEYKKVKSCSIKADIFPARRPHSPVMLYIHGGALISGSRRYAPGYQVRLLNREGFSVVSIDYRLAPETQLENIIEDVRDAIRWIGDEGVRIFGFDAGRLAVMGSSAGGYLSLMTGTFAIKPKAIVSIYGYGDILGDWYSKPSEHYCRQAQISEEDALKAVGRREKSTGGNSRYAYYFYTRQQGIWAKCVSGFDPIADRQRLVPYCPLFNVRPDYPPTIFLHGSRDTDVPYEQSVAMNEKLRSMGIESELITMHGMDHGFDSDGSKPEVKEAMNRVMTFLHRHV
jgi:acetyl esterase/lipase